MTLLTISSIHKQKITIANHLSADNGAGMKEEVLNKIFAPFYTTKRGQCGSGLGMYIVYNLVTSSLNSQIDCQSQVDSGTTFQITLPISVDLAKH